MRRRLQIFRSALALFALVLCNCSGDQGTLVEEAHEASGRELGKPELAALGTHGRASGYDLLVITLDTVRADRLGCSGYARAATPVIDELAQNGVRYEHAIASAPITLPSHATLFTGLNPTSHGVRNNGTFALDAKYETLAERLNVQGYRTGAFIGAYVLDERYGLAQGFDLYDDDVNPSGTSQKSGHYNERSANGVTDAALEWMKPSLTGGDQKPTFTWVHYFDAHHPYAPPGEYASRFRNSPYDGEIAFIDSQIARILKQLESSGRLENTLVVITSDHGEGLGEHSEETHSRLLYDSTLRVPLILSCKSLFGEAVVVRDRVVGLVDIFPTLLDLLGLETPTGLDGEHLFAAEPAPDRAVYVETLVPLFNHGWAPLRGLHRLEDKFISAPAAEYFDVLHDPGEEFNLYPESPPQAAELEKGLRDQLLDEPSAYDLQSTEEGLDAAQAERLAALGYTRSHSPTGAVGVLDPKKMMPIWSQMMQARSLTDSGRHIEALALNKKVLDQNPGDAFAWETASLIHVRSGRPQEAESALQRMLKIMPSAEGYVRLAQLQLQRKDYASMQGSLGFAEALDPREGGVHMVAGDAYAGTGRFQEALQAFERALELDAVKWGQLAREKIQLVKQRLR
ncbi:MAG: arylsulfatase A-like enzyme [Planctomycetota bacterium]|jgi:arylsulfatase A-like enzyme